MNRDPKDPREQRERSEGDAALPLDLMYDLPVDITVELGRRRMTIGEFLELGQNAVLELRKLVGKDKPRATVPVLVTENETLTESWDIAKYADREGSGSTLIPTARESEVRTWNELADAMMSSGRGLVVMAMLSNVRAIDEGLPPAIPKLLKRLLRPVGRYGMRWFARKYGVTREALPQYEAKIRSTLQTLRGALPKDSPYLLGAFSYADIVMDLVEPIANDRGLDLVDVEYQPHGRHSVLRLYLDRPGGISLDEMKAATSGTTDTTRLEAAFKATDTDGDGKLSPSELEARFNALHPGSLKTLLQAQDVGARAQELLTRLDSDGDGSISRSELTTALASGRTDALGSGDASGEEYSAGLGAGLGQDLPGLLLARLQGYLQGWGGSSAATGSGISLSA